MSRWYVSREQQEYVEALMREAARGLHPGVDVSQPLVGEQLPQTFMYGEQGDEPTAPSWEQVEAALARRGMVAVDRAWYADAQAAMKQDTVTVPTAFPATALRGLQGERWR